MSWFTVSVTSVHPGRDGWQRRAAHIMTVMVGPRETKTGLKIVIRW